MALQVQIKPNNVINTNVKKVNLPLVNLEQLKNVNSQGLKNGDTLIWDENTQTWITQEITLAANNIDGGTY